MFTSITIERFRGIKHAYIDGFKHVNLFFGKNNCGKSTLMESLLLGSGMSNPVIPVNINLIRGYSKAKVKDLKLEFYNLDTTQPIHIRMENGETRDLDITLYEQRSKQITLTGNQTHLLSTEEENKYGLKLNFRINGEDHECKLQFEGADSTKAKGITDKNYEEQLKCTYLSPKFDFATSITGLANILQNKDERFIIDGLKIIEPKVNDFAIADDDVFVDTGLSKRIPVNMMGDGARKILSLLTSIYGCKDGILLIDEISNGFHYSVMKDLWRVLIAAAVRNRTQLFVTTHDIDSIKGLRDAALGNDYESLIATYKLLRTRDDELKPYAYSLSSVDYSINQEIEIR